MARRVRQDLCVQFITQHNVSSSIAPLLCAPSGRFKSLISCQSARKPQSGERQFALDEVSILGFSLKLGEISTDLYQKP